MKKILHLICFFLTFALFSELTSSSGIHGLANLNLRSGKKGIVPFPHRLHQNSDIDCNVCHSIFPKHIGSIEKLITNKELVKKHVMNKLCISCHKRNKSEGTFAGPITCKACHLK